MVAKVERADEHTASLEVKKYQAGQVIRPFADGFVVTVLDPNSAYYDTVRTREIPQGRVIIAATSPTLAVQMGPDAMRDVIQLRAVAVPVDPSSAVTGQVLTIEEGERVSQDVQAFWKVQIKYVQSVDEVKWKLKNNETLICEVAAGEEPWPSRYLSHYVHPVFELDWVTDFLPRFDSNWNRIGERESHIPFRVEPSEIPQLGIRIRRVSVP